MRWIACCLLSAGVLICVTLTLANHFRDAYPAAVMAELGLSQNPEDLAAPEDPEPSAEPALVSSEIDLFASPIKPVLKQASFESDPNGDGFDTILLMGGIDANASAYRVMPRCQDGADAPGRMPRCDEAEERLDVHKELRRSTPSGLHLRLPEELRKDIGKLDQRP